MRAEVRSQMTDTPIPDLRQRPRRYNRRDILRFIQQFRASKNPPRSPSQREIQRGLEIRSSSTVSFHLNALKREGKLISTGEPFGIAITEAGLAWLNEAEQTQ